VQVLLRFIVTLVEVAVPLQSTLQPEKTETLSGTTVRSTLVPLVNIKKQVEPQAIPSGLPVIVPPPVPDWVTSSVTF
jgi:hypothetical protein